MWRLLYERLLVTDSDFRDSPIYIFFFLSFGMSSKLNQSTWQVHNWLDNIWVFCYFDGTKRRMTLNSQQYCVRRIKFRLPNSTRSSWACELSFTIYRVQIRQGGLRFLYQTSSVNKALFRNVFVTWYLSILWNDENNGQRRDPQLGHSGDAEC